MTQRSVILQKKLHELEFELADVFRLPPHLQPGPRHRFFFDDVEQRFIFLKNLLSAEVASRPQNTDQLHEIGEKLTGLEAAFRGWDKYRTSALNIYLDDTLSVCSDCTQTLLNDDVEANAVLGSDSPVVVAESFDGQESPEKWLDENVKKEESGRIWGKFGKYCGVFGGGMIIGAICMIKFSSSSDFIQYEAFLLPPT
ncbi:hypothetical protein Pfo_027712 [Paulownia fortunei]|nr:hypothetical protein Pfo_027712 [Paulownia fortunei]